MSKEKAKQRLFDQLLDLYLHVPIHPSYHRDFTAEDYFENLEPILEGLISPGAKIKGKIECNDCPGSFTYKVTIKYNHKDGTYDYSLEEDDLDARRFKFLIRHGVKVLLDE